MIKIRVFQCLAWFVVVAALAVPFYVERGLKDRAVSYELEISDRLPPVQPRHPRQTTEVPDFSAIHDVNTRKIEFFSYLLPAIDYENSVLLEQRRHVSRLLEKHRQRQSLTGAEQRWLNDMARYYRVTHRQREEKLLTLMRRVDVIPDTLVLIQAANESGWGTSRFALDARNFFGQWCWNEGCGIVPAARPEGAVHEVQYFESVEASVRAYIRNLNTHPAYYDLRSIRADLRRQGIPITAQPLTLGLLSYSERGEDYIAELNQMIRVNRAIIQDARMLESLDF
ncbi:peptidoglycan hydrolase [Aliidiomarina halalkaliphila]|uniref:Peptidoglycan hydrolase n=1 Tax=Aliidiomarina halalkaliphila TaxID=2593535 RepID=A0A552X580_9GAMM|nr:glucosaminidase domain-containing protein [Aliidiomarina halalkaliphila]TRW49763.1 peptidoglycan hydrolase [Aliidiomarina halalkaliphila]